MLVTCIHLQRKSEITINTNSTTFQHVFVQQCCKDIDYSYTDVFSKIKNDPIIVAWNITKGLHVLVHPIHTSKDIFTCNITIRRLCIIELFLAKNSMENLTPKFPDTVTNSQNSSTLEARPCVGAHNSDHYTTDTAQSM